jgi:hypothetical protein
MLHLPPLEAGTHQIRLRGEEKAHRLTVPPLSAKVEKRAVRRIVVK